ncbi:hypothetical protein AMTRI_Chr12g240930 [Amborella trichopoda]|uniref:Uncharacterized protein n=1 Tax=Amborella trichopoda TaxID=13333 RepID=W1PBI8_AMBTC|nr:transcription factor MYB36 [Amborella trichopoda]ERN07267.1 hypothetical protein AMTR_s00019p00201260 [Amborella trichopoda]|eukprot:XP_006845592.1 transcription factor MYB36 [Amborella trichopoda]
MGRAPCCDKANVKKGPWSPEEDAKLKAFIEQQGTGGNWIALPQKIGLKRCGKSCRLRWLNYLRPNIKHGGFSEEEDRIICSLYISIGSRWSIIAAQLPGRTDNDIKNYWNTKLKKKLLGRRKEQNSRRDSNADARNSPLMDSLSTSALERMQLHIQLQSLHHPLSLLSPSIWPRFPPLFDGNSIENNKNTARNFIPNDFAGNLIGKPPSNGKIGTETDERENSTNGLSSPHSTRFNGDFISQEKPVANSGMSLEAIDGFLMEEGELQNGETRGFLERETDRDGLDCFREMESTSENLALWVNDSESGSFNSWDTAYILGTEEYDLEHHLQ